MFHRKLLLKTLLYLSLVLLIGITACSTSQNSQQEEGGEENTNFSRDLRLDSWGWLIGDTTEIESVLEKMEAMYDYDAGNVKVDMANASYTEGNWHFEFAQLAEAAEQSGDYFAAFGYYSIAAFPFYYDDETARTLYAEGIRCFKEGLDSGDYPYEVLTVTIEGTEVEAFVVYPENIGTEPVPAVIETGGIDGLMAFMFADYLKGYNEENIAWVGFDMYGNGTSHELTIPPGEDVGKLHAAVIEQLQSDERIDSQNIFAYGRSLAGYVLLRMVCSGEAGELGFAGIASSPAGEKIFHDDAWAVNIEYLDDDFLGMWFDRLGIDPSLPDEDLVEACKSFNFPMSEDNIWEPTDPKPTIPLLVMNTSDDPMSSVEEVQEAATCSQNGQFYIAWDEEGHCPSLSTALEQMLLFIEENKN